MYSGEALSIALMLTAMIDEWLFLIFLIFILPNSTCTYLFEAGQNGRGKRVWTDALVS